MSASLPVAISWNNMPGEIKAMAANPSVTWHISLHLFLFQTVCNIDKVISVVVTRYVFPTFSSLTLALSMSSRALVPAPLTNTQHSSVPPLTAHHWPQTQEEKRNISKMDSYQDLANYQYDAGVTGNDPTATNSLFLGVFITLIPKVKHLNLLCPCS